MLTIEKLLIIADAQKSKRPQKGTEKLRRIAKETRQKREEELVSSVGQARAGCTCDAQLMVVEKKKRKKERETEKGRNFGIFRALDAPCGQLSNA